MTVAIRYKTTSPAATQLSRRIPWSFPQKLVSVMTVTSLIRSWIVDRSIFPVNAFKRPVMLSIWVRTAESSFSTLRMSSTVLAVAKISRSRFSWRCRFSRRADTSIYTSVTS